MAVTRWEYTCDCCHHRIIVVPDGQMVYHVDDYEDLCEKCMLAEGGMDDEGLPNDKVIRGTR